MGKLFGTDGVRGRVGTELTVQIALKLGLAFGEFLNRRGKVVLGRDTRISGPMLERSLVAALNSVGVDVVRVGVLPTPAISLLVRQMGAEGGVMITASHNPYEDNGLKFFDQNGRKLSPASEEVLEKFYHAGKVCYATGPEIGSSWREDASWDYLQFLKGLVPGKTPFAGLKVVVDSANGATYRIAPHLLEELGAEVVTIGNEPDGTNINRGVGALYPEKLGEKVREVEGDVGFGLDGDGDRLVVVDQRGIPIDGDHLIGGIAQFLYRKGLLKGGVVVTIMSNAGLERFLKGLGIPIWRSPVGDRNLLQIMEERGANFGGEQSGHIIFKDYAQTGDGLLSLLIVLQMMVELGEGVDKLFRLFPLLPQLQTALPVSEKIPLEQVEGFVELITQLQEEKIRPVIRYSGTENKLRILLEGEDRERLHFQMDKLCNFFQTRLR